MPSNLTVPVEELHRRFSYDPETGSLTWISRPSKRVRVGSDAGFIDPVTKYRRVGLAGRCVGVHRVIWAMQTGAWPQDQIDHINGVTHDNRWVNLREATNAENNCNRPRQKNNKSGFKGVRYDPKGPVLKPWRAAIERDGQQQNLGFFAVPEEAHAAYCAAAEVVHGEFARFE